jgi:polyferredoxin
VTLKGRTWVLVIAGVVAVFGAILAFALHNPDKPHAGLNLDSFGLVLMTAGLIVLAGWADPWLPWRLQRSG